MISADELLPQLQRLNRDNRCLVGYSGGLDSTVLLHLLADLREQFDASLIAIHINHGLQPEADAWQQHCAAVCEARDIPLQTLRVEVDRKTPSLEAAAREARHAAFASRMQPGDLLVTAHHRNDQAETLLLNLMRGSGLHGLAAMPPLRDFHPGRLWRPLLHFSREQLEAYASEQGLEWIEDPSNAEIEFDRNFLRNRVIPLLEERWPVAASKIARSAELVAESVVLLDQEADKRLYPLAPKPRRLDLGGFLQEPDAWRLPLLRHWLRAAGAPSLPGNQLIELLRQLESAADDRQPAVEWHGWSVRRYDGKLWLGQELPKVDSGYCADWDCTQPLVLPAGLGSMTFEEGERRSLQVRFRREGDSIRYKGHTKSLKAVMQELAIPPWLRDRVPLVIDGERLVAIADRRYADEAALWLLWHDSPEDFHP
ncbi:MAG: tRNA lysidine(34) synthetase TilS [Oceanisphaera sp.]|nr:tRNA lysidine(34) synthetase TilS [Oceanisphaera sp.]